MSQNPDTTTVAVEELGRRLAYEQETKELIFRGQHDLYAAMAEVVHAKLGRAVDGHHYRHPRDRQKNEIVARIMTHPVHGMPFREFYREKCTLDPQKPLPNLDEGILPVIIERIGMTIISQVVHGVAEQIRAASSSVDKEVTRGIS